MPIINLTPGTAKAHWDAAVVEVELSYRMAPLVGDYLRGAAGLALTTVPLIAFDPAWPVMVGLTALTAMFAVFLVQTWRRQHVRVLLGPSGVALVDHAQRRLAWNRLERLRLRWFGSRRQGKGWLELELAGDGQRLVLSSALEGFDRVVAMAVAAARDNDVALEPATSANIQALLGSGSTRIARA